MDELESVPAIQSEIRVSSASRSPQNKNYNHAAAGTAGAATAGTSYGTAGVVGSHVVQHEHHKHNFTHNPSTASGTTTYHSNSTNSGSGIGANSLADHFHGTNSLQHRPSSYGSGGGPSPTKSLQGAGGGGAYQYHAANPATSVTKGAAATASSKPRGGQHAGTTGRQQGGGGYYYEAASSMDCTLVPDSDAAQTQHVAHKNMQPAQMKGRQQTWSSSSASPAPATAVVVANKGMSTTPTQKQGNEVGKGAGVGTAAQHSGKPVISVPVDIMKGGKTGGLNSSSKSKNFSTSSAPGTNQQANPYHYHPDQRGAGKPSSGGKGGKSGSKGGSYQALYTYEQVDITHGASTLVVPSPGQQMAQQVVAAAGPREQVVVVEHPNNQPHGGKIMSANKGGPLYKEPTPGPPVYNTSSPTKNVEEFLGANYVKGKGQKRPAPPPPGTSSAVTVVVPPQQEAGALRRNVTGGTGTPARTLSDLQSTPHKVPPGLEPPVAAGQRSVNLVDHPSITRVGTAPLSEAGVSSRHGSRRQSRTLVDYLESPDCNSTSGNFNTSAGSAAPIGGGEAAASASGPQQQGKTKSGFFYQEVELLPRSSSSASKGGNKDSSKPTPNSVEHQHDTGTITTKGAGRSKSGRKALEIISDSTTSSSNKQPRGKTPSSSSKSTSKQPNNKGQNSSGGGENNTKIKSTKDSNVYGANSKGGMYDMQQEQHRGSTPSSKSKSASGLSSKGASTAGMNYGKQLAGSVDKDNHDPHLVNLTAQYQDPTQAAVLSTQSTPSSTTHFNVASSATSGHPSGIKLKTGALPGRTMSSGRTPKHVHQYSISTTFSTGAEQQHQAGSSTSKGGSSKGQHNSNRGERLTFYNFPEGCPLPSKQQISSGKGSTVPNCTLEQFDQDIKAGSEYDNKQMQRVPKAVGSAVSTASTSSSATTLVHLAGEDAGSDATSSAVTEKLPAQQAQCAPKMKIKQKFDFTILREIVWKYLGYNVEEMKAKTNNSFQYEHYKKDCIAWLRFLLSQESQNCEWKLGYLLAMCLKEDFSPAEEEQPAEEQSPQDGAAGAAPVEGKSTEVAGEHDQDASNQADNKTKAAASTSKSASNTTTTASTSSKATSSAVNKTSNTTTTTTNNKPSILEYVLDSQMFSLLTQLFIQDTKTKKVDELEQIFLQLGGRKKNSHVLAAMIRGYGCKGHWKSSLKLFLHARERQLDPESKDYEYRYLCYQAALDWALQNEISFMIYTVLRFCQIDQIPIRYPGGISNNNSLVQQQHSGTNNSNSTSNVAPASSTTQNQVHSSTNYATACDSHNQQNPNDQQALNHCSGPTVGGVDFVRWPVEELRFIWPEEPGLGAPKIKYYVSPSTPEDRVDGTFKPLPTHCIVTDPRLVELERSDPEFAKEISAANNGDGRGVTETINQQAAQHHAATVSAFHPTGGAPGAGPVYGGPPAAELYPGQQITSYPYPSQHQHPPAQAAEHHRGHGHHHQQHHYEHFAPAALYQEQEYHAQHQYYDPYAAAAAAASYHHHYDPAGGGTVDPYTGAAPYNPHDSSSLLHNQSTLTGDSITPIAADPNNTSMHGFYHHDPNWSQGHDFWPLSVEPSPTGAEGGQFLDFNRYSTHVEYNSGGVGPTSAGSSGAGIMAASSAAPGHLAQQPPPPSVDNTPAAAFHEYFYAGQQEHQELHQQHHQPGSFSQEDYDSYYAHLAASMGAPAGGPYHGAEPSPIGSEGHIDPNFGFETFERQNSLLVLGEDHALLKNSSPGTRAV
ncbi:unnamed protein product [Amoebophrya sp. A120]|nr:unnamed protein product [Amoebophrya sp. A120]|eukprot:GSA120T00009577001.1